MGERTAISWTDHTFSPVWGCIRVSPGCEHCYAEAFAKRMGLKIWGPSKSTPRRTFNATHWSEPLKWNRLAARAGVRRRVFCGSMCDIFEDHPTVDQERAKLWPLIRATPHLDWQLLTKRPERITQCLPDDWDGGYPNVWLGTSVEDQPRADLRVPLLIGIPATVRFLSCEPLLGPVDLTAVRPEPTDRGIRYADALRLIDWIIVGGESGPKARPMLIAWAGDLRNQCAQHRVAFFFKQRSGPVPGMLQGIPEQLLVQEFPVTSMAQTEVA